VSAGGTLAEARRQAGLTIPQVSQKTRIRESIIRAIEQGDFSACGGDFYARGHIRSIASAVGLDPAPVIGEYEAEHGPPPSLTAAQAFEPTKPIRIREPRRSFGLGWILVAVVILGGIAAGYELVSRHHGTQASTASASVRPAATAAPKPKVTHAATHGATPKASPDARKAPARKKSRPESVIVLTANQPCWVGITSASGQQLYQGIIPAGQSMTWREQQVVSMVIGNTPGITLTVDGKNATPSTTQVATLTISPSSSTPVTASGTGTTGTTGNSGTSGNSVTAGTGSGG
jgi:cytoskeletal protein RodZ